MSIFVAACSARPPGAIEEIGSYALTKACPLHVRAVGPDQSIATEDLIGPKDVAGMRPAKPYYKGDVAAIVELGPAGDQKLRRYSASHVGGSVAFFCNEKLLSRAVIVAPFGSGFRMTMPD